jgi:anti-sigma B factor antagonist
MPDFQVRTATQADRLVVTLAGECDMRGRDELTSTLLAAVDAAPLVVVDLAALRFMDSSGLHALVTAFEAARERGRHLYAVNASGSVATVLEMTGVLGLLQMPGTVDG